MSKTRNQDALLADFAIHLAEGGHRKIRASSLIVVDGWLYLRDAGGAVLFAAPHHAVRYVKRLEPGEIVLEGSGPLLAALADPQCTAQTEAKRRCRLPAVPGTDKCTIHTPAPAVP